MTRRNESLRSVSREAPIKYGTVVIGDGPAKNGVKGAMPDGSYFCDSLTSNELSLLHGHDSKFINYHGSHEPQIVNFFTRDRITRRAIGTTASGIGIGVGAREIVHRYTPDIGSLYQYGIPTVAAALGGLVVGTVHNVIDNSARVRRYKNELQEVSSHVASSGSLYVQKTIQEHDDIRGGLNQSIDPLAEARHPEVYKRMLYESQKSSQRENRLYGVGLDRKAPSDATYLDFTGYDDIYRELLAADEDPSDLWTTFLSEHMKTFITMQQDVIASQDEFAREHQLTTMIGDEKDIDSARSAKEVSRQAMNTSIFEAIAHCAERQARQRVEKATLEQRAVIEMLISGPQNHRDDVRPAIAIVYQEVEKSMVASSIATETDAQTMRELADYVVKTAGLIATPEEIERVYKSLPQKFGTTFTFPDWSDIEHKVAEAMLPEIKILR